MLCFYEIFAGSNGTPHAKCRLLASSSQRFQHVFNVFGNARDAQSGQPLFNKTAWQKANAVLELAREGYLSDVPGITVFNKVGVDQYGLDLFDSRRGTNKLEGGPHSDIYWKFCALRGMFGSLLVQSLIFLL